MKAVMISIQPKWCELIANGEKTIEVRKTRPNIETPFKCYIYCTKSKPEIKIRLADFILDIFTPIEQLKANGKVIGEFICDEINEFKVFENGTVQNWNYYNLEDSCLTYDELANYIGFEKYGYAWHMSALKIYDKPKELSEFSKLCEYAPFSKCYPDNCLECSWIRITRPPQGWQYCEELEEKKNE